MLNRNILKLLNKIDPAVIIFKSSEKVQSAKNEINKYSSL